jgi:hypothetical protein
MTNIKTYSKTKHPSIILESELQARLRRTQSCPITQEMLKNAPKSPEEVERKLMNVAPKVVEANQKLAIQQKKIAQERLVRDTLETINKEPRPSLDSWQKIHAMFPGSNKSLDSLTTTCSSSTITTLYEMSYRNNSHTPNMFTSNRSCSTSPILQDVDRSDSPLQFNLEF